MIKLSIPAGQYPSIGYDGGITFAGVLQNEFCKLDAAGANIGLSRRWNDNTASQYARHYVDRLLPIMKQLHGAEKPMHQYTDEDFDEILAALLRKHHFAESTMMHYRYLLWIVYRAGFENGLYPDNIFWDELLDPLENPEEFEKHRVAALTRIRKSFSIVEDLKLMQWFLSLNPSTATGPEIALVCMYFLGCRNNEACGADFSAFHPLRSHPDTAVFDMVQTTVMGSNDVKSSGKSKNAPRTLPVHPLLYDFIQKRRAHIERLIADGALALPKDIKSVVQLPVACVGTDFVTRAQTNDLSRAGRALFQMIGIHKSELAVLHQIMFSEEFKQTQIDEKDPTTYLFRRNVATRLYHLGFKWTTIQYWIAHEIEDSLIMRNYFADEDILYELSKEYEKHPVFQVTFCSAANRNSETVAVSPSGSAYIIATANEPGQGIDISIKSQQYPVSIKATELPATTECPANAAILNSLYQAYRKVWNSKAI